jgi:hypothetical protein
MAKKAGLPDLPAYSAGIGQPWATHQLKKAASAFVLGLGPVLVVVAGHLDIDRLAGKVVVAGRPGRDVSGTMKIVVPSGQIRA